MIQHRHLSILISTDGREGSDLMPVAMRKRFGKQ